MRCVCWSVSPQQAKLHESKLRSEHDARAFNDQSNVMTTTTAQSQGGSQAGEIEGKRSLQNKTGSGGRDYHLTAAAWQSRPCVCVSAKIVNCNTASVHNEATSFTMWSYQNSRFYSDCIKVINTLGSGSTHHRTHTTSCFSRRFAENKLKLLNTVSRFWTNRHVTSCLKGASGSILSQYPSHLHFKPPESHLKTVLWCRCLEGRL